MNENSENKKVSIIDIIENGATNSEENNISENKIIFDINIDSVEYLIKYLVSKNYDFFTLEAEEDKVKVTFRKDNIEKEIKYIKFPVYSNIVLKAKILTKLDTSNNTNPQEGKTEIVLNKQNYKIISKTVPSNLGERLFLKATKIEKKVVAKKKEKMSFAKIMTIFGGLSFTTLILGGVFLAVILFKSTSVSDLQFFNNLGIDTNAIKDFTAKLVNLTFGIILLIIILLLFIFSYKAILTKKEFKKKRVSKIIISIFLLILSVSTLILWMFLSQKINSLRGINYGKIEYYDNSKYISKLFTPEDSIIDIKENIIGPITIRFNDEQLIQKLIDEGFKPQQTIWKVAGDKIEKPAKDYELIYEFKNKGLNNVKIQIKGTNIKGETDEKNIDLGVISLNNSIKITELKLDNGGSKFIFDASDLKYLGKIKWYYIPSIEGKDDNEANKIISKALSKELLTGYKFNSKNIFEGEEYYGIKIISGGIEKQGLDKIFVVNKGDKTEIQGNVIKKQDLNNSNKYTFSFKTNEDNIGEAYIKKFTWEIEDFDNNGNNKNIIIENNANLSNLEESSQVNYTFKKPGIHKIKLIILDSNNKESKFTDTIDISKKLELSGKLNFFINSQKLEYKKDYNYDSNDKTYNLDDIGAPTVLKVNALKIKTINQKYGLKKIYWDLDNNGSFEKTGKIETININTSGLLSFKVKYVFVNKNIENDTIDVIETIHIMAIEKEFIPNLQIIKTNSYVPIVVQFDATNSKVTGKNIDKFIFDYGDGTPPEERDAKNTGHKYFKAGDYTIKLTIVTEDGQKYKTTKKLVLKNKPQKATITASLKKAPLYQDIDFSAEDSIGEISTYFWDFGDGTISTEISPSHSYKKIGKYKVTLKLTTTNNNELKDEIEINIYED